MQELRLVAVSEDGTYLVLATAGRGTRFTLPVDDRLRAAVRGNFSRLGQYEIEVESPLRPKEIQARIRAGETAEEIAATAGIPVERVRWFEGPVLQEREYMAQQAQRCAVRLPGEAAARPTLGELVAERLTRRGVPTDEIDWDSCKRDDNLWRIKLGYVWNGHTRHAEWLFDPRRRHVSPYDDEAMRLSADDYVEPQAEEATVRPFVPRIAGKLAPVPRDYDYDLAETPPLRVAPTGNLPDHFSPRFTPEPAAFHEPEPPRVTAPHPEPRYAEPPVSAPASYATPEPPEPRPAPAPHHPVEPQVSTPSTRPSAEPPAAAPQAHRAPEPQAGAATAHHAPEPQASAATAHHTPGPQAGASAPQRTPEPAAAPEPPTAPEPQGSAPASPEVSGPAAPSAVATASAAPESRAEARPSAPGSEAHPGAPASESRPGTPDQQASAPATPENGSATPEEQQVTEPQAPAATPQAAATPSAPAATPEADAPATAPAAPQTTAPVTPAAAATTPASQPAPETPAPQAAP
uniref:septation protein SepH n=1 Tax=Herbidospora sakaeratensis TaxID=564415 RepID=UPI000782CDA4